MEQSQDHPMKTVYADNNATTPVAPEVIEAMILYFTEGFYNQDIITRLSRPGFVLRVG